MNTSRLFSLLSAALLAGLGTMSTLAGCETCEGDNCNAPLDETTAPLISTYYTNSDWLGNRAVYARKFDPSGAPRVLLSFKEWGQCKPIENRSMVPVPAGEISAQLCSSLGLTAKFVDSKVAACVSSSAKTPANLWKYSWSNMSAREVNYKVIDQGIGGKEIDTSGWVPTPSNGCPK